LVRNQQRKVLHKWFGVCQKTYNEGVALVNKAIASNKKIEHNKLTKHLITDAKEPYKREVPVAIR
jgi:hypothetical protein